MATKPAKPASPAAAAQTLENNAGTAGVPATAAAPVTAMTLPKGVKVKNVLTLPSLSMTEEMGGMFLKIKSGLSVSDIRDRANQKDPATVCDVERLELGEDGEVARVTALRWLVPAVVFGNLVKYCAGSDAAKDKASKLMEAKPADSMDGRIIQRREVIAAAELDIVGKVFAVQHMGKRSEGQRYNDYNIAEVELA